MRIKWGLCIWHTGLSACLIIIISLILFPDHICWYTGRSSCVHCPSTCLIQSLPLLFSLKRPWPLWTLGHFVAASSIEPSLPLRTIPPCLGSHQALEQDVCLGLWVFGYL